MFCFIFLTFSSLHALVWMWWWWWLFCREVKQSINWTVDANKLISKDNQAARRKISSLAFRVFQALLKLFLASRTRRMGSRRMYRGHHGAGSPWADIADSSQETIQESQECPVSQTSYVGSQPNTDMVGFARSALQKAPKNRLSIVRSTRSATKPRATMFCSHVRMPKLMKWLRPLRYLTS